MLAHRMAVVVRATALLGGLALASGRAEAESLQNLIDGQTLNVGDKIFSDWALVGNDATPGFVPDLSLIEVEPFSNGALVAGLRYHANDQWTAAEAGTFITTEFRFRVAQ